MGFVNQRRYIDFRIVDNSGHPVTNVTSAPLVTQVGSTIGPFTVNPVPPITPEYNSNTIIFQRNDVNSTDILSIFNHEDGRYTLMYTPSGPGHDYVDLYDHDYNTRIIDRTEIANIATNNSIVVFLNQDFSSVGFLNITVSHPEGYTLFVFNSTDWVDGRQTSTDAIGSSALTTAGNWVTTIPVPVPGTYHIVLMKPGTTIVAFPFVVVS